MNKRVKAKRKDGKFWTFGSLKEGKFGLQLSFRNTPELKELISSGGDWINFALFDADDEKPKTVSEDTQAVLDNLKGEAAESDEIPF